MKGSRRMGVPHRRHGRPARPYALSDRSKYPDSPLTSTYMSSKDVPPAVSAWAITAVAASSSAPIVRGASPAVGPVVVDLGRPEGLVRVDVADPGDHRLVEQRPFDHGPLGADLPDHGGAVEQRVERVAGNVRDGVRQLGAAGGKGQTAEGPLVEELEDRPGIGEAEPGAEVRM